MTGKNRRLYKTMHCLLTGVNSNVDGGTQAEN